MSTDYQLKLGKNGQIIVIMHPDCNISREDFLTFLRETGIDGNEVEFLSLEEVTKLAALGDCPVVIPLDAETCDNQELEAAALSAGGAGGRVIAVFGPEFAYEGIHPIAEKYGTQCGWSPSDLASILKGKDAAFDGTGAKVTRRKPKQVDCN